MTTLADWPQDADGRLRVESIADAIYLVRALEVEVCVASDQWSERLPLARETLDLWQAALAAVGDALTDAEGRGARWEE